MRNTTQHKMVATLEDDGHAQFEIEIDLDALLDHLAKSDACVRTGKADRLGGSIKVRMTEYQPPE